MGKKVSKDFLSSYLEEIQNSYLLMNQLSWLKNRDKLSQVEQINVFIKENILFIISHHDIVYLSEWNLYLSHVICQAEPFFFFCRIPFLYILALPEVHAFACAFFCMFVVDINEVVWYINSPQQSFEIHKDEIIHQSNSKCSIV